MLSNFFLKSFRILLFPFSLLYWVGIVIRNKLFDKNIFKSSGFALPLICVGNLAAGGTGKSPMVEYLIKLLKSNYKIATLSRGYKRKTKGYTLANEATTALEIGDEPMQFYLKFPEIAVAVGEERIVAIPQLLQDKPSTEVIILDDALQHRSVSAGLNILLTEHSNLFTRDFYLPTGDLRDLKSSYKRVHIIVITKCNPNLAITEKNNVIKEIKPLSHQQVYFTAIEYGAIYHLFTQMEYKWHPQTEVLLVTGIANPKPLQKMVEEQTPSYHLLQYSDHHIFTVDDLAEIKKRFNKITTANKIMLTTEKDAVRLVKFKKELLDWPIYVVPIKHRFLFNEGEKFDTQITDFINQYKIN
ncbi:MAG: hypothetical protein RL115_706 [Bacteroidota bacterium]|jgi:tetraacyldisaccharide 4'-kinase